MIQMKKYPECKKDYKKYLTKFFIDYCINTIHPIKHFKILSKAYTDYKIYINR